MKAADSMQCRAALGAAFAFLALAVCGAQESPRGTPPEKAAYAATSRIDWKERVLRVDVELDMVAAGLRMPEGRLAAERMMERDIASLAKDAVFALQADSHGTIEAAVAEGSFEPEKLVALTGMARVERSSFSRDMRKFTKTYALSLDAVASLFLTGAEPSPIRAPLELMPTRDYTGIVIYAKGRLPVRGEEIDGKAAPCLFPRVYDSEMHLLLDRSVVAPEILARDGPSGGVLGYASGLGVEAGARVGGDPMRVMAAQLFGDARTDYVISREDALRILSSSGNRELLRQGKIVVILDFQH
jgi:hypothetical protein